MADANVPPPNLLDGAALFLDFDGTLVDLAETPDSIRVPEDLGPLLGRLSRRLGGRLAIVSGRAIRDLDLHLDCSALAVAGSHGIELRMADGREIRPATPASLADTRAELMSFAGATPGILIEDKPYGIAVHYRQAPAAAERIVALVRALAARTGLTIQFGKMVAELRAGGAHKGDALRALMMEPVFIGARPVFVGDDLTDEDAFAAAAALGGVGVLVGPGRPSVAAWRLRDVGAVREWLDRFAQDEQ